MSRRGHRVMTVPAGNPVTLRKRSGESPTAVSHLAAGLLLIALAEAAAAQPAADEEVTVLVPGRPTAECGMIVGETDRYQMVLDANLAIDISIDQRGIDVAAKLIDPDGELLVETDGITAAVGAERVSWVARDSGRHLLEVTAGALDDPEGCYEITYEEPHAVSEEDRRRSAAASALAQAHLADHGARAIARYEEALASWRALGDRWWQAEALNGLGSLYFEDQPETAIRYFKSVLELETADPVQVAFARTWLGYLIRTHVEDLDEAQAYLEEARKFWSEKFGADSWLAIVADNLGLIHHTLGDFHDALSNYDIAIPIWRRLGRSANEASTLENRGWIHYYLARLDMAFDDFSRARSLAERHDPPVKATTLTALSYIHTARDETAAAIDMLQRALDQRAEDRRGRAVTEVALGWAYHQAGDRSQARQLYDKALRVFEELGEVDNQARVRHRIGQLDLDEGEVEEARRSFEKAHAFFIASGDVDGQAEARLGIARCLQRLGHQEAALREVDQALQIVEELRKKPVSQRLRALFFASKQHFFEFKISLLAELNREHPGNGFDLMAFSASEQARARSLVETLTEAGVDLGSVADHSLLDREERLLRKIKSKIHQSTDASRALDARAELRQLQQQYDAVRLEIRSNNPLYATLTEASPLDVGEIRRRVLDENTLLLEYFIGREHCFLWAVTPDAMRSVALDVTAQEIEDVARKVYDLLPVSQQRKYRVHLEGNLAWLSERLLKPVEDLLPGKRLLIVPSGALQYVPFSALPVPGGRMADGLPRRLAVDHQIVSLPSASTLGVLRTSVDRDRRRGSRPAPQVAAVLADPVFEPADARLPANPAVTRNAVTPPYGRLQHSLKEAEAIKSFAPNATVATGFDANKQAATNGLLKQYRFVHLATHGTFDAQFPERSRLIFSLYDDLGRPQDGYLYLPETYRLGLSADLVVLSACQTALGEEIRGEGLVGMTQGFMYSGAPRVLASLWNVQDESTSVLMALFYHHLLERQESPAAALRAARVDFLARYPVWNAPYYWAGFILQGDF